MEICLERIPMNRFETRADKLQQAGHDAKEIMKSYLARSISAPKARSRSSMRS